MRPLPFVTSVSEIRPAEAGEIPGIEAVVSYWTEGEYASAEEWFAEVTSSCGTAGFVVRRGEEVLGYAVYGPKACLPRAGRYPVGPLGEDAALLAFVGGEARARRHLLARCMRDLKLRGFGGVEAITSDLGLPRHVPTRALRESGWKPVRRGWRAGLPYTLMRADFGSTVEVGELARAFVGKVRWPIFETPNPTTLAPAKLAPVKKRKQFSVSAVESISAGQQPS